MNTNVVCFILLSLFGSVPAFAHHFHDKDSCAHPSRNGFKRLPQYISNTDICLYEFGKSRAKKALLLSGDTGVIGLKSPFGKFVPLAKQYQAKGIQLVLLSIPYYGDQPNGSARNSVRKGAQEVLNILDYALDIGYIQNGYTLLGNSGGSLIISAMLDFNQKGEVTHSRLIDDVGRIVLLSGPFNNIKTTTRYLNPQVKGLMKLYHANSLFSLNGNNTYANRWNQYLGSLINNDNLKIVIGNKDYFLCRYGAPCNLAMHKRTLYWFQKMTQGSIKSLTEIPAIVNVIPNASHNVWKDLGKKNSNGLSAMDFILN